MFMQRTESTLVLVFALSQLSGCGGGNTTPPASTITSVSVSASPSSITTTQTATCVATVSGTGTFSAGVTWTATGGTINSSGVFTPSGAGTATCTATSTQDATKSGSATITVTIAPPTITSVSVSASPSSITTNNYPPGLNMMGDSIACYSGATTPLENNAFAWLIANRLGGSFNNYCPGAWMIQDEPTVLFVNGPAAPTQGNNPFFLEEAGKNDGGICQGGPDCDMNSQLALITVLTQRATNNIVPVSSCTKSPFGAWTTDSVISTAEESYTNSSTLTCTITTYGNSAIAIPYRIPLNNAGTASVTIDGILQANGIVATGVGAYPNPTDGTRPSVFTNLYPVAAGSHTIVITVTSATSLSNLISIPNIVSAPDSPGYFGAPLVGSMEVIPYRNNANPTWGSSINTIKQSVVSTLQGYGFMVEYLPITNVPCTNGVANCTGGFNANTYIDNQPSEYNPDGLSCAGLTSEGIHPNDCGHWQMYQALQTDLNIIQSTAICTATVTGTGAFSTGVTWTATSGTINSSGVFIPSGAGAATCTAKSTQDSTKSGSATITVTVAPPTITSVSVSASPSSITTTHTAKCSATVSGTGAFSAGVAWTATGGTINSSGVFIPSGAGTATCTATSTQDTTKSGSAAITVTALSPMITSVTPVCSPAVIPTNQTSTCTPMGY